MGDAAVGLVTLHHYNADLDNPQNKAFVAAWRDSYGAGSAPDFMAVGGYDGMAVISHAVEALQGRMDGDKAVAALKGWTFDSPRGPVMIDPETRDVVMNEYLVEVVKGADGKLHQKLLATIENVKDVCKAQKIPPCR
jgi:branched-chain amino acid transport system substrate-binding protein